MTTRKRPLTPREWIELGNDLKEARRLLQKTGILLSQTAGVRVGDTVIRLAHRIDSVKFQQLEGLFGRQHPDLDHLVIKAFSGDPLPLSVVDPITSANN